MSKRLILTGKLFLAGFLIVMAGWLSLPQPGVADDDYGQRAYVGTKTCMMCHEDVTMEFSETPHGVLLGEIEKYKDRLCETCHGPGSVHAEEMNAETIINPAKLDGMGDRDPCLTCHGDTKYANWDFSPHAAEGMHCADCHQSHAKIGQTLTKEPPELCYDCHTDVRASFYMPSHHPLNEGVVSCLDCHNVHGDEMQFAVQAEGRQRCISCHPHTEGPFIFEHEPVTEDCGICHEPHGAVANNLLVQTEPALCLNCHSMHFHATIPGITGDSLEAPQQPGRFFSSTHDGFKEGFLTKCTQCHTAVHGSDLPAQSISGGGKALTR
jgi:DmsE family decaheme c-type cytochrome